VDPRAARGLRTRRRRARRGVPLRGGSCATTATLHLYYGAADTVVCVAEASLATLLDHLAQHPCPPESAGGPLMGTIGRP